MSDGLNIEITAVINEPVSWKTQLQDFVARLASGELPSSTPVDLKTVVQFATVYAYEAMYRQCPAPDRPDSFRLEEVSLDEDETVWQVILSFGNTEGVRQYRRVWLGYLIGELRGIAPYDPLGQ